MSEKIQSTDLKSAQSPATAMAELPTWVVPVRYFLTAVRWIQSFILLVIFAGIFAAASPVFMEGRNITNIILSATSFLPLALGMMLTMRLGGIDLSVAGIGALISVIVANLLINTDAGGGSPVVIALAIGFLIGLINGTLTAVFRVPAFAVTLGVGAIARGLALSISGGRTLLLKDTSLNFLTGASGTVPFTFWLCVVIAVLISVVLVILWVWRRSGQAGASGWPKSFSPLMVSILSRILVILVFAISGVLAALGGLYITARLQSGTSLAFSGTEITVLAAVVIGSVSLLGGMGNPISVVVGVLAIGALTNGLILKNVASADSVWIIALILVIAAAINTPLNLLERWLKQRQWVAQQMKAAQK